MLFTDRLFVTSADLAKIDTEFQIVAAANNINVDNTSDSVLYESVLAAGEDFLSRIQNFSGYLVGVGVNSNSMSAVMNVLSTAINRPRALLSQIVVKEPNPTRGSFLRWIKYCCLFDFYRGLFMRRVQEDRFRLKMLMYEEEKKRHWRIIKGTGFPIVLTPFACPGAIWEYGSGVWGAANVASVAGTTGDTSGTQYSVSITWVSVPGYLGSSNQAGAESGGSYPQKVQIVDTGDAIQVNLIGLNPPTGIMQPAIGTAPGVLNSLAATGWNIYVGTIGNRLILQNSTPIPIGTTSYTLPSIPVVNGFPQNEGQPAQYDFSIQDMLWRS